MRNELAKLVEAVPDGPKRAVCLNLYQMRIRNYQLMVDWLQAFSLEMDNFYSLFTRYLSEKAKATKL